ncbi:NAD(P)/FAD-dependent oxidoreductase [Novosphingobium sp. PS1R-30]|uniref:NAD(P)/FAD-dependent oxidoreductase n=1 Tax=Novosphingobium anseongense TaxID=3133436 RepID=A0ABU8RS11_9SPHN
MTKAMPSDIRETASPRGKDTRFVIIGSGISGVLMAIKLLERGYRDIVILEKAGRMGGTWRDNVYPGVACDVAAHLYSYSFARNPWWNSRYAKGADIWAYYHGVARHYGVLPLIRYYAEVLSAEFGEGLWQVTTRDGDVFTADVVIAAAGRLHRPVMPEIEGLDSFAGALFHTARWDQTIELADKRVGVIGTGSSATQIVTALAGKVERLSLFQRTAQWVFPVKDTPNSWWTKLRFWLSKRRWDDYYRQLRGETEARGKAATSTVEGRAARDQVCHDALAGIRDPELRAKLTPDYDVGCKRLVFSDGYYEAVQHPSVDVVVDPIARVVREGVVTESGKLHELDVLALATGFDAHAYIRPMQVTGEGGVTLDEVWRDLPLSYRSIAIPHMPNFLMINGPYSPGGTSSVVGIAEAQVDYILQLIDRIVEQQVQIVPREEPARAWLDGIRAKARDSVWGNGGCQSWYLDKTGTPTLDTSTLSELQEQLAEVQWDHFVERPR